MGIDDSEYMVMNIFRNDFVLMRILGTLDGGDLWREYEWHPAIVQ